jgi:hypothetical protein
VAIVKRWVIDLRQWEKLSELIGEFWQLPAEYILAKSKDANVSFPKTDLHCLHSKRCVFKSDQYRQNQSSVWIPDSALVSACEAVYQSTYVPMTTLSFQRSVDSTG